MTYFWRFVLAANFVGLTLNVTEFIAGDADVWDGVFGTIQAIVVLWWYAQGERVWTRP